MKLSPLPHQQDAITNVCEELKSHDRATVVMACGTGKTLVSLWVAEEQDARNVLILVPSLALAQQVLKEWVKHTKWHDYVFLCVCSDKTVSSEVDDIVMNRSECDFHVTTDATEVSQWFRSNNSKRKLVFSTYHSAEVVSQGMPSGYKFDLAVFDEAHKTAGTEGSKYAYALKDNNIHIAKRVFFTATPKHYEITNHNQELEIFSMCNEAVYGKCVYNMSFRKAIDLGLIVPYKIIISVITSDDINRHKLNTCVINESDVLAKNLAIWEVINQHIAECNIKRILCFHNFVQESEAFVNTNTKLQINNKLQCWHIDARMSSNQRQNILNQFRKVSVDGCTKLISSARCLTEGVDIPDVDMVAFLSPRKSNVDIIQAVGRTMRKSEGKECGYIFLPLFVDINSGESPEEAANRTEYEQTCNILNVLKENDESLADFIKNIYVSRFLKKSDSQHEHVEHAQDIEQYIKITGKLSHILNQCISTIIVDRIGSLWDKRYAQLISYKHMEGHTNVPQFHPDLGFWVGRQRQDNRKGKLTEDRKKKLEELGFIWDTLEHAWQSKYEDLKKYKQKEGHVNVPISYPELGVWVARQRKDNRKGKLTEERKKKLQELGFEWDIMVAWESRYEELKKYKENHGNSNVPYSYPELGLWAVTQRQHYRKGNLTEERKKKLQELGFKFTR